MLFLNNLSVYERSNMARDPTTASEVLVELATD